MLKNWEKFEDYVCKFLTNSISNLDIKFKQIGGADSTNSDINVLNQEAKSLFFIEVKLVPAQSGQFVLLLDGNKFKLTDNSNLVNSNTFKIIEHINDNFDKYNVNGNVDIKCDKQLLIEWVKEHYSNKRCRFIITSFETDNYIAAIPLEELDSNFNISACIRRKRSGTRHVPKNMVERSLEYLNKYLTEMGLKILTVKGDGRKTMVKLNTKAELKKCERYFGNGFYLSPEFNGHYSIKKQSETNNVNVVFSITYKGKQKNIGLDKIRQEIIKQKI